MCRFLCAKMTLYLVFDVVFVVFQYWVLGKTVFWHREALHKWSRAASRSPSSSSSETIGRVQPQGQRRRW